MALGEKLKQTRLEAGLSQRQLCGDTITRNMLSQIENGSARPSVETLRYLAGRLGKPVSFFLDEDMPESTNQYSLEKFRNAYFREDWETAFRELENCTHSDLSGDKERQLLVRLTVLEMGAQAREQGRQTYGIRLLEEIGPIRDGYCPAELERRRLLELAELQREGISEIVRQLPNIDQDLLLRAQAAIEEGRLDRGSHLLDAVGDQSSPRWNYLRGHVYAAHGQYRQAADCYHRAEHAMPERTAPCLERCYRELGDYKQAYEYACRQRQAATETAAPQAETEFPADPESRRSGR